MPLLDFYERLVLNLAYRLAFHDDAISRSVLACEMDPVRLHGTHRVSVGQDGTVWQV